MKAVWTVFIAVAISTCCSDFLAGQSDVFPSLFPVRCYFTGQTEVPIGDTDLTTADVDGDGSVDILNIDSETDLLTVWFNNGNGLFAPNLSIPVPDETLLAGVGNFNDDGIVDFLLLPDFATGQGDIFWIVASSNNLTYQTSAPIQIPLISSIVADVADFNGDGLDDIIASASFGDAVVLLNNGSNQFSLQAEIDTQINFGTQAVVIDIDLDSDIDLVFSTSFGPSIHLNDGGGNFNVIESGIDVFGEFLVGDVNADNQPDLIASATAGQIIVFLNDGNLQFEQSSQFDLPDGNSPFVIELVDINGDDDLDIFYSAPIGTGTFVLDNDGNSNFGEPRLLLNNSVSVFGPVAFVDIENDGDNDMLFSTTIDQICVAELENGVVPGIQVFPSGIESNIADSVDLVDMDDDGDLDLVVVEPRISVFLNSGDGTFSDPQVTEFGSGFAESAFGDLDNDSDIDIVILNRTSQQISIALNNGGGTFSQGPVVDSIGGFSRGLALADLNGDSNLDIVALLGDTPEVVVSLILNQGDGTFLLDKSTFMTGVSSIDLAVADFDGDADVDLVVTNGAEATTTILFNDGDAFFSDSATIATDGFPVTVAAADMDGDLDQDFVVATDNDAVTIFLNDGMGDFKQSTSSSTSFSQSGLVIDDFDCDGRNDIFIDNFGLLRNLSDSNLAPFESYFATLSSVSAIGDIDGDGNPDFVSATADNVQVSINQISVVGDVNRDGQVNLLDVAPFIDAIVSGRFQKEADVNSDGAVDLLDVNPFIALLSGG